MRHALIWTEQKKLQQDQKQLQKDQNKLVSASMTASNNFAKWSPTLKKVSTKLWKSKKGLLQLKVRGWKAKGYDISMDDFIILEKEI